MRARRKDANHRQVQDRLEVEGFEVQDVSMYPGLGWDLIVTRYEDGGGPVWFLEVKDGEKAPSKRKLTLSEAEARSRYPRQFRLVNSPDEALEALK